MIKLNLFIILILLVLVGCSSKSKQENLVSQHPGPVANALAPVIVKGALSRAVFQGNIAQAQSLLEAGADPNENIETDGENEITPLLIAVATENVAMIHLLQSYKANSSARYHDYSPLDFEIYLNSINYKVKND